MALSLAALTGLLAVGCGTVRAGYETAPYQVVRADGKFELRDYPALVWVETSVHGSDDSFMRLFRFIGGDVEIIERPIPAQAKPEDYFRCEAGIAQE